MNHDILLSKWYKYGIQDVSNDWFRSYLSDRNQKCFVNGHLSYNLLLSCGIPQGTILGPLLFLTSINDLPNCLSHCQRRMYADDTHLTFNSNHIDCIDLNPNQVLINIIDWLIANKLALKTSKIELLIGSRKRFKTLETAPSLSINIWCFY